MRSELLSRRDVAILKGTGILLIFLHNYFHWQPGMGIENEFAFKATGFKVFLANAFDGPLELVRYSLAYFGHFGVQLFVLTSGYGLTISARKRDDIGYFAYLLPKLIKIFALLLIGAVFISVIRYINDGHAFNVGVVLEIIVGRMSGIWNFSGSTIFRYSGPFWFFGLIVQLYVLFPVLDRIVRAMSQWRAGLMLIAVLVLNTLLYPLSVRMDLPLMGIFVGHLPVFLLGMLIAREDARSSAGVVLAACSVFILGQYLSIFFMATFISAAILMLGAYLVAKRMATARVGLLVGDVLQWVGGISMAIFVINGPLRTLSIFRNADGDLLTAKVIPFTIILLVLSIPVAFAFKKLSGILLTVHGRAVDALRKAGWKR